MGTPESSQRQKQKIFDWFGGDTRRIRHRSGNEQLININDRHVEEFHGSSAPF